MPFVLLSGELDCNRCIAKQTKIVKMIGELSAMTILRICRHVVNYPFLQIILRHSCQFGHTIRQTFLDGNLRVLKTVTSSDTLPLSSCELQLRN